MSLVHLEFLSRTRLDWSTIYDENHWSKQEVKVFRRFSAFQHSFWAFYGVFGPYLWLLNRHQCHQNALSKLLSRSFQIIVNWIIYTLMGVAAYLNELIEASVEPELLIEQEVFLRNGEGNSRKSLWFVRKWDFRLLDTKCRESVRFWHDTKLCWKGKISVCLQISGTQC